MPSIPLYHFQPQGSGSSGVRANPHLLDAKYEGGKRLGAGIANLADPIARVAQSLQHAKDFKDLSTVDMAMQEEWDAFQTTLNPSTDETKWVEAWNKQLDARLAKVMPKNAGAQLKQELQLRTGQFKVRTSGDVGLQAKGVGVQKGKAVGLARTDQLLGNGEAGAAEANLNEMARLGFILPEQVPALMQAGHTRVDRDNALRLINTDPIGAMEVLEDRTEGGKPRNFTHLDEGDRYSLMTQAERNASQLRAGTYQGLVDRMGNGELLNKDEMDGLVERKLLTSTQAQSILRQQKTGKLDTGAFADLSAKILNYERGTDVNRKTYAELFAATLAFPEAARSALLSDLNAKDDPTHKLNNPAVRDLFQRAESEYREGLFLPWEVAEKDRPGWFTGSDKVMVQPGVDRLKKWKDGTLDKPEQEAASKAYATYLTKMRAYVAQKPDATDVELEAYSQQLKRPYVMQAVSAALTTPAPSAIPQAAIDRLKADPKLAKDFDAKFGEGAAAKALGK